MESDFEITNRALSSISEIMEAAHRQCAVHYRILAEIRFKQSGCEDADIIAIQNDISRSVRAEREQRENMVFAARYALLTPLERSYIEDGWDGFDFTTKTDECG